jgi:hypothetical protein
VACRVGGTTLPRLGHYVDNNSTPTMFSNTLERKYFLALYPS